MSIPITLSEHLQKLKDQGYCIEVIVEGQEIIIIFKEFPLSKKIWNREKTDLLVKTNFTYPQAKMDMFWVTPGLKLVDDRIPHKGDHSMTLLGKEWQRFSWHPSKWIVGRDNIQTFLDFIKTRLEQMK